MKEGIIRSISGIVIGLFTLSFIYSRSIFFSFSFIFIIGLFMAIEWNNITKDAKNSKYWVFLGVFYIFITLLPLLKIKFISWYGRHILMWIFILVWSTDTFAYFVGKVLKLGKHKINEISPKKSYEGLLGGIIGSMFFCNIFAKIFLPKYSLILFYFTPILCCIEQIGDFTESYIKRKFDVKDSGNIIPGHGGFLDRFDGFLYLSFLMLYILEFI